MEIMVTVKKKDEPIETKVIAGLAEIGRLSENEISLMEVAVSRKHAKIEFENNKVFITDLGSSNGTYVNGTQIEPSVKKELKQGDEVNIAMFSINIDSVTYDEVEIQEEEKKEIFEGTISSQDLEDQIFNTKVPKMENGENSELPVLKFSDFRRRDLELKDKETFIGKGKDCKVYLKGFFLAKHNGVITKESDGHYSITNLASLMKIKVNDEKLNKGEKRDLKHNDEIKIGSYEMIFCYK